MSAPQKYRQRYVAFRAEGSTGREDVKNAVSEIKKRCDFDRKARVLIYNSDFDEGLIRCGHLEVEEMKKRLKTKMGDNFEILGVSGTIRKAKLKFLSF